MKDQANRDWLLDEEASYQYPDKYEIAGKVTFAVLLTMILVALLVVYVPTADASGYVSCDSLVDAWGEE